MSRPRILLGLALFVVALTCLAFADTGAQPPEEIAGSCSDWWCARRNAIPIGLAILTGGLGAVSLGMGFISGPDAEEEDAAAARERLAHPEKPRFERRPRR